MFAFHDAELCQAARPDAEGDLATRANSVSYRDDTTGSVAFLSEIVFSKDLHGQSGAQSADCSEKAFVDFVFRHFFRREFQRLEIQKGFCLDVHCFCPPG